MYGGFIVIIQDIEFSEPTLLRKNVKYIMQHSMHKPVYMSR